ncbi:amidohydrolase [Parasporobacterium paucivorans]|uniref:5-methylthioadenosine/S-adenosylhomocysteine deaminase n=1 Tax=Parasporobacterium paucivorans DSM 15970 TaxID=1122934 RepID=A0A1M6CSQ4_9FIRM|nr:amidohydrolase [Parasporobacterium paucivorans]SHI64016.1 5-methylthioadenosine/S-adenosylhomocysteine deaminase [Parasporobacterium paucivorans DSM 15970]
MIIRFYNAQILDCSDTFHIRSGDLYVTDDRISYIGPHRPDGPKCDREINLNGNLIIPGFKNAHTHSPMTFLRSFADDRPLDEWLNKSVFPMEAKLTPDKTYIFSIIALMEYLTSGITANFDMYFHVPAVAAASADCGFRTVICGCLNNFQESLEIMEEHYKNFNQPDSLLSYKLGFHAEYTTSRNLLEGIADMAARHEAPVFTHNSETLAEVEGCMSRYNKTPTALFEELGIHNFGGGGFHCVHLSEEDTRIFKDRGLFVVTNPASNLKLASGIAPVERYLRQGIPVAIGTDGPASNNCLDMFREMYLVTALQKQLMHDASACPAESVLDMAVTQGALAMGLFDCDKLAVGKKADLAVIDLNQPNMRPINDTVKNLVYSGSKQNVRLTMVNGKILYEDGLFYINQDVEEIYSKAAAFLHSMK